MSYELTKSDKITILNQHIKNLSMSEYNAKISLTIENASMNPSQESISSFELQIVNIGAQKRALEKELESLTNDE
jgi:hypothetical protein